MVKEDKHQNGVAVLARKELLQGIDIHHNVKFVSDRIIQLNLYIDGQRTSVLSVYAPTNSYDIDDKLEFYDKLHELTSDIPRDTRLFICGDFNARVGRLRKNENLWKGILGNFGSGLENENGLLLLEYCAKNDLRICNTSFKHKFKNTWKHEGTKAWHSLDHILCRKSDSNNNIDCFVDPSAECWTDHHMVILKHRLQNHKKVRNYFKNKTNSNAEKDIKIQKLFPAKIITSENLQDEIGEQIDKKLEGVTLDRSAGSISERYNTIVNAVYEVCAKLLKPPKRKCQYWFDYKDPHIETLLDQRRALCKKYLQRKTERSKIRFKNAKIKVRSALRQMENKFWENKCKEMQYFAEKGKTHQLYKAINQAYGPKHSKNFTQTFLKKDGNPTTTPTLTDSSLGNS